MTIHRRVIIASRRLSAAWAMHQLMTQGHVWQVVGIIDPRVENALESSVGDADIILIEADDLLWLLDHRMEQTRRYLRAVRPVIQFRQHQILDVVTRGDVTWGLLPKNSGGILTDRLDLAIQGYLVMPAAHWLDLQQDRQRLDIVARLSPEERRLLALLGAALPNRTIARMSDLTESRVKTLTHVLRRKLRLRNRTAIAVFSVENGFALPTTH